MLETQPLQKQLMFLTSGPWSLSRPLDKSYIQQYFNMSIIAMIVIPNLASKANPLLDNIDDHHNWDSAVPHAPSWEYDTDLNT